MEVLMKEHERLAESGTLSNSLEHIQEAIDHLVNARESIAAHPEQTNVVLAPLQKRVHDSFDTVQKDLAQVHKHQTKYGKLVEKKFKDKTLPQMDHDALTSQPGLINRAIAMHLLREGQFSVASTFMAEATKSHSSDAASDDISMSGTEHDLGIDTLKSESLRKQFAMMYHILHEMKNEHNLLPATQWARSKSDELNRRGSNLEFELGKLQFIWLYAGQQSSNQRSSMIEGRERALQYAREELCHFRPRYLRELQQLGGALAFCPNLQQSPYRRLLADDDAFDQLASAFTREFCSLLGLSADSPLYIAATAGAIALPHFSKLELIMKDKRTEWTTEHEIPVEVPLPPSYRFHSIFVCPVSKEQTTDSNPPMMMPCGHVVAEESLMKLSRNNRFKCPYCPNESHPKEAMKILM
ncbi:MAG: hypothetical protein Q9220_005222 [cf. Caloplaca sp. 1 TL-2023]